MALINRWDIRQESYSDSASITSLTDQQTNDNLSSVFSSTLPTYNSTDDEMSFSGDAIGTTSLSTAANSACKGTTWTVAALINQGTLAGDFLLSYGANSPTLALSLRTNANGTAKLFARNSSGTESVEISSPVGEAFSVDTDTVIFAWRNGSTFGVAVEDNTGTTTTATVDLSAETFDRGGLGAWIRNGTASNTWTGGLIEARFYDSDESANRLTITAEMKSPPSGGSDTITADVQPAANRAYVDIGTPATAGDRITATPVDLATGDQVAYDTRLFASDGVTPTAYTVSIDSAGVFTLGGGPIPDGTYYIKDIRVYDNSDSSWGALADQTVTISSGQIMTPPTTIYVNMSNTGVDLPNVPAPWSYNNFIATKGTSVQQITADLKDWKNASTGLTLDTINPVTGAIGSDGNANGSFPNWPEPVFEYAWYVDAVGSPAKLRIGGLQVGDTYRIEIAGHQGTQPARDTDFTIGGTTTRYDNTGTPTPAAPIVFSGTTAATTLDIDAAIVDSFAYLTGFRVVINGGNEGRLDDKVVLKSVLESTLSGPLFEILEG